MQESIKLKLHQNKQTYWYWLNCDEDVFVVIIAIIAVVAAVLLSNIVLLLLLLFCCDVITVIATIILPFVAIRPK